VKLANFCVN